MADRPLVGVICCTRPPADDPVQGVAERYLRAAPFFGADVVLIPSMPDVVDAARLVRRLDGVLLTGSPSNVAPPLYGRDDPEAGPFDFQRDATSQALIEASDRHDRPLLGICRGFQEFAVAYGSTLRRDLAESTRGQIHHARDEAGLDELFALRHDVELAPASMLARATGARSITVNSAHYQGIAQLGEQLVVEATSQDGIVESVRPASGARLLAVQWHPEWGTDADPAARALFRLFAGLLRGASLAEAADQAAASAARA